MLQENVLMRLHGQMAAQVTMLQLVHLEPAEQLASDVDQLHRGGTWFKDAWHLGRT